MPRVPDGLITRLPIVTTRTRKLGAHRHRALCPAHTLVPRVLQHPTARSHTRTQKLIKYTTHRVQVERRPTQPKPKLPTRHTHTQHKRHMHTKHALAQNKHPTLCVQVMYACMYVKIRRHQHTRAYTRTQARGATPVRAPACRRHHIPRLVRRQAFHTDHHR